MIWTEKGEKTKKTQTSITVLFKQANYQRKLIRIYITDINFHTIAVILCC